MVQDGSGRFILVHGVTPRGACLSGVTSFAKILRVSHFRRHMHPNRMSHNVPFLGTRIDATWGISKQFTKLR